MVELLAPAKDYSCAKAAIDFGADAVYIGANRFGARQNASNTLEEIEKVINYAHQFYIPVYVTMNTLLNDDEVENALKLTQELWKIGADALIIQDMGILQAFLEEGAINDIPPIPLHASTQCHNNTCEKVDFLEKAGFQRVILARELSLDQIKEVKKRTNIELEVFIHGALCVAYSGMCFLSEHIGKRSANRGECAQPCRKKYSLCDDTGKIIEKDKHLLNLKDFNASEHLQELIEAGITSFKIEGRLKDENYVKNVVGYYRRLLDNLCMQKAASDTDFDLVCNPEKSFNRGFTTYFLNGRTNEIYNFNTNKSLGEKIGVVKRVMPDYFEFEGKPLNAQDGICWLKNGELKGCLVNRVEKNRVFASNFDIEKGAEIFRNQDFEFEKKLKNSKTKRRIPAKIKVLEDRIEANDLSGNYASVYFKEFVPAQNPQKALQTIKNQLLKTGETIFKINEIEFKPDTVPFLLISKINELRRKLLENLLAARLKNYKRKIVKYTKTTHKYPEKYFPHTSNAYAKRFCDAHGAEIKPPEALMTTKHCLKYAFKMCKYAKNLYLIDEKGVKFPLKFDCKNCEMQILPPKS